MTALRTSPALGSMVIIIPSDVVKEIDREIPARFVSNVTRMQTVTNTGAVWLYPTKSGVDDMCTCTCN
jgi:hypothetical protein